MTLTEKRYLKEMMVDWLDRFGRTPTVEEMNKALENIRKRG